MQRLGRYFAILLVVMVLWNTIIIKPLRLFTVFLHELGHALMAFIFGFGISGFRVNLNESGYTIAHSKGWFSDFMITNGGYLGSVFFAILILYLARTMFKNYILGGLAILLLGVSIKFSGLTFTLLFSSLFAVFVLLLYMINNDLINEWVIDIIGVASVAYAIYDTFVDTVLLQLNITLNLIKGWKVDQPATDAVRLAQLTHIPAIVWGIIWFTIAVFAIIALIIKPGSSKRRVRR